MRTIRRTVATMAVLVLLSWSTRAGAQEKTLTVTLLCDSDTYARGLPVFTEIRLKNAGTEAVTLGGGTYLLELKRPDGSFSEVKHRELMPSLPPVSFEYPAGAETRGWDALLFRARQSSLAERELIFGAVGAHTFRKHLVTQLIPQGGGERVRVDILSNEVTITVKPEEKGYEAFLEGLKKYTIDGARLVGDGVRWMEQVIEKNPDSVYAQYAKGLIIGYWCGELGWPKDAAKMESDPRFLGWPGEVVTSLGNRRGFISCNALYLLALSHIVRGEPELAEPFKAALAEAFPETGNLSKLAQVEAYIQRQGLASLREQIDRQIQQGQ